MNVLQIDQARIERSLPPLVMLLAVGLAPGTFAQGSDPSGVEKVNPAALEEVVVTAQKREQSLQDVPVAVTALTQETLEVNSVINVNDLNGLAPNLSVRPSVGSVNLPVFNMRGITSYGIVPGSDKQISTYLDGVYLGSPRGGIFTLPDIQRLEVLRGPQGTLFGRNATGGAISVVTRDPSGELGFRQKVGVGNRNYLASQSTLDTPAWGPLSAYLTYTTEEQDGDIDNLGRNFRWDRTAWGYGIEGSPKTLGEKDDESFFGVAQLDYDTFRLTYKFDYNHEQGTPQGNAIVSPICGECLGRPGFNELIDLLAVINSDLTGTGNTSRPGKVNNAWSTQRDQKIKGHNLTAYWDLNDSLSLTNILAYRDTKQYAAADISGTSGWVAGFVGALIPPVPLGGPFPPDAAFCYACSYTWISSDQWSDELQLNYSSDSMTVTAGALYYWSKDNINGNTFQIQFYNDGVVPGPSVNGSETHNKTKSYAAYTQVEFNLTDTVTLLTGVRYTRDDKEGDITTVTYGELVRDNDSFDYDNDKWSYLLGVQYSPTEEIMVYGKYSTAFVSGGATGEFEYDPEEAESWEIGSKAQFFDNRLRANLSLFDVTYKHLQSSQAGANVPGAEGIGTLIVECCTLDTTGVELELTAVPNEAWLFSASGGYQDSEYHDVTDLILASVGGFGPNAYPGSSYEPTLTPEWNANLSANYTSPTLFDEAYLNIGVSGIWQDKIRLDANPGRVKNGPFGKDASFIPSQWIWNARAALTSIRLSDSWTGEIALWGRNLTDKDHITFSTNFGAMFAASFMEERSYGIDFVVNFE